MLGRTRTANCKSLLPSVRRRAAAVGVQFCRQPTLEEREFLEEEALEQDRLSIKLERLHFDGRS